MKVSDQNYLKHYGTLHRSGRYPWGSGEHGFQRHPDFLKDVRDLKAKGLSESEIAKGFGLKISELRAHMSVATDEKWAANAALVFRLKEKGMSNAAISKRTGLNDHTVQSMLDPAIKQKRAILAASTDVLRSRVDDKGYVQVGSGVEVSMGISRQKLDAALQRLKAEGYVVETIKVQQIATGKYTNVKVLAKPGSSLKDISQHRDEIALIEDYSEDGGRSFRGLEPVVSMDRSRIMVRYGDEGGSLKDGVLEIRRGVDDISLGEKRYAQVRVGVNGTHYMKGMAMYAENMPEGVDIIYNTNKPKGSSDDKVFKPMKTKADGEIDQENPFGANIRQRHYVDAEGKTRLSPINAVGFKEGSGEEGSWGEWSKSLSSQVLSKQRPDLAKKQLGIAYDVKNSEYEDLMTLTNPAVKRRLLQTFADEADSAAVTLKAAALPRQANRVLLPINSLKENEVYAPSFRDGETVVLIRHPHGGIFEIPELTVNNKNREANKILGKDTLDAVGIHPKVAAKLSGADFDGDTVLVIPNNEGHIRTSSPIGSLVNFDTKTAYPKYEGMKPMDERTKQHKMGEISNLITDMTIKGATPNGEEIARAVRHSMVVIDAVKHELNWKKSYQDNGIEELCQKYQGKKRGGASTLISKAKSLKYVPEREEGQLVRDSVTGKLKRIYVDPKTGRKLYQPTGRTDTYSLVEDPKTGKKKRVYGIGSSHPKMTKTSKMAEETDAFNLSSGTRMEDIYAEHANKLKALANKARLSMLAVKDTPYSPEARKTYHKEVESLKSKLSLALRARPLERQAQLIANKVIRSERISHPQMEKDDYKKLKWQVLEEARSRTKSHKDPITFTDREWEAIQAGAVTKNFLRDLVQNTEPRILKMEGMLFYTNHFHL